MFSPIGTISFSEAYSFFDHVASQYWSGHSMQLYEARKLEGADAEAQFDEKDAEALFKEKEVLTTWILAKCLNEYEVLMCAPDGRTMVPSPMILYHEDRLHWYDWSFSATRSRRFDDALKRFVENDEHPSTRFRFLDFITGTVCVAGREHIIRLFGHEEDEDIHHQMYVAEKFNGWAIAFTGTDFPTSTKQISDELGLKGPYVEFATTSTGSKNVGRPSLQRLAMRAYQAAFPNGHANIHWSEVEDRVEQFAGRKISAKTIGRALAGLEDNLDKTPDKT